MRKVIAIGESVLDLIFDNNIPVKSFPGGRIINSAASIATAGVATTVVSECGADKVGDAIVDYLAKHNVITSSIDRFTDGNSSLSLIFSDSATRMKYGRYPVDRFDVVWTRIDEDDIVIFGSFYSIDTALRLRFFEMLTYATERKAILIYLPGFQKNANCRITKIMTAILENLEVSSLVIAKKADTLNIFEDTDAERVFKNKIKFYCSNYIHIEDDYNLSLFSSNNIERYNNTGDIPVNTLGWHAGFCAGIMYGLLLNDVKQSTLNAIDTDMWSRIVKCAYLFAHESSSGNTNCISEVFGAERARELEKARFSRQQ